ncbi:amino acid ABC transporter substrate-binding protein [Terasakiella sp. A23]|uniref:amino acid ABC transporter substrate-binding protein n=1 Tax=Terasakiella sp. FCG-A23 TaxID=3080561 RepID=UPI002952A8B9|nr:amino acid ABC transporter substrate-binding protein [Terasakiella sp. A23]MDV7340677.1 amino acid ABC transporter substrate-binding protein [Terasakiella sp. A23]
MKKTLSLLFSGLVASTIATSAAMAASTLETVQNRGTLTCGVTIGVPGFSLADENGVWRGLDVDVCRAVAAAVVGDAQKVKFVPLTAKERFTALQSGEVDILSRVTTWTHTRDTSLGLNFTGVNYYDGQGFMVQKELGVNSALELDGASVCIQSGTTTELNLADYFRLNKMQFNPVVYDTAEQTIQGFAAGRCDILTSDQSQLYALRSKLDNPDQAMILPEVISKEPLGPVVRQGDDQWFNIIKWTLFAVINAEELNVTQANVDDQLKSANPNVQRLLGTSGDAGVKLGLTNDWAYKAIKQVGNYGEMFDRNVGPKTPLQIARGLNALWSKGGLQYAPPVR